MYHSRSIHIYWCFSLRRTCCKCLVLDNHNKIRQISIS